MRTLIVIPARGGSKGIPKKNIFPINGKPLLEYTLDAIIEADLTDIDVVVSTDSEDIKKIAEKYFNVNVVDRPKYISGDLASTEDALLHAIGFMEQIKNITYDSVMTLQPTSPLRKAETLKKFLEKFERIVPEYDAMLSLHETKSDLWINNTEGTFERLFKNAPRRRQERNPLYVENSAYYITLVDSLRQTHSVLGNKTNGYIISEIEGIDINEHVDILIAKIFLDMEKN